MRQESIKLRRSLHYSFLDGAFYSLMIGTGETYIAAFVLALGFGEILSGLVTALPIVAGSIMQLFSYWLSDFFASRRKWVIFCACTQGICLLGLASFVHMPQITAFVLFFITSLYWAAGMSAGPAWNAWMGSIVPKSVRINFFSLRSRAAQSCVFIGLVIGGLALHRFKSTQYYFFTYSCLFVTAALFRFLSAFFLSLQVESSQQQGKSITVSKVKIDKNLFKNPIGFMLVYLFLLQFTMQIASPYLNPYMLKHLQQSYTVYMILLGAAFLSRVLFYPFVAKVARVRGAAFLVWIGAMGITPLPVLWNFGSHFMYLLMIQLFAGFCWACHELGILLTLLDRYSEHERSHILTLVNFLNSIGMLIGSLVGAYLIQRRGLTVDAYHHVFAISTMGRACTIFLLPFFLYRKVISIRVFLRILGVHPTTGAIARPILYVPNDEKKNNHDLY